MPGVHDEDVEDIPDGDGEGISSMKLGRASSGTGSVDPQSIRDPGLLASMQSARQEAKSSKKVLVSQKSMSPHGIGQKKVSEDFDPLKKRSSMQKMKQPG